VYENETGNYLTSSVRTIQSLIMTLIPSTRAPYQYIFPTDYSIFVNVDMNVLLST